uniref:Tyrosine-protein kinase n=1 Tax=Meloidogyne javanica TaxID=6303 RepID=A0A915M555_MELJA
MPSSTQIKQQKSENLSDKQNSFPSQTEENLSVDGSSSSSSNVFVALYDFQGIGEEKLALKKGDKVKVIGYNKTKEWCEVKLINRQQQQNNFAKLGSPSLSSLGGVVGGTGCCSSSCSSIGSSVNSGGNYGQQIGWVPSIYIAPSNSMDKHSWYHGKITRIGAEQLLSSGINGSFLVRESETNPGQFSISLRHEGTVYHYRINCDENLRLFITDTAKFKTLGELIHHHSVAASGLICALQYPVNKRQTNIGSGHPSSLFSLSPTQPDEWEVDREQIVMKKKLGMGQYGDVYEALWLPFNRTVAVKSLKEDQMALPDFLAEAAILKELHHENLVELLGVCTREAPYFIICDFMSRGNLLDFLRQSEKEDLPCEKLLHMSTQVAAGMAYLETRNFIHRDLAARNCLINDDFVVKVADFGLARFMTDDTYTAHAGAKFPIKWTAPEGLAYNTFSTKSDVWAFGVLLWEIFSYGMAPYPGVELGSVIGLLEKNFRLERPTDCPDSVHRLMLQCWQWSPSDRPRFHNLHKSLYSLLQSEKGETTPIAENTNLIFSPERVEELNTSSSFCPSLQTTSSLQATNQQLAFVAASVAKKREAKQREMSGICSSDQTKISDPLGIISPRIPSTSIPSSSAASHGHHLLRDRTVSMGCRASQQRQARSSSPEPPPPPPRPDRRKRPSMGAQLERTSFSTFRPSEPAQMVGGPSPTIFHHSPNIIHLPTEPPQSLSSKTFAKPSMPSTKNQKLFARLPTVQFVQKEEGLRSGKNLTKLNLSGTGTLPRGFSLDTSVKRSGSELKFPEPFEKNEEKNGQEKEEDKVKKPLKEEKEEDSNQTSKLPLQHLKMRLKKTTSETSAVQSTSNNQQTDEPNSSRLVRPEPKPRRSVDPSVESCLKSNQKTKFESSSATTSGSSLQNIDEEIEKKDNELHAKIKQLRHVQRVTAEEEDNTPEGNEGTLDEQSGEIDETDLDRKMTKMKIENERSFI